MSISSVITSYNPSERPDWGVGATQGGCPDDATTISSWLVRLGGATHARVRLYCFPPAGGGALSFRPWVAGLQSTVELYAAQLPGREWRLGEPPVADLPSLVSIFAEAMTEHSPGTFALYGHSMGALVAFELAREIRRRGGGQPVHLLVSGFRGPHLPQREPSLHNLPEAELLRALEEIGGTPTEVLANRELMTALLPALRADFAICETYCFIPGDPLDCPLAVFGGLEDDRVSVQELSGWSRHTRGAFTLQLMEGGHFFPYPFNAALLREISAALSDYGSTG